MKSEFDVSMLALEVYQNMYKDSSLFDVKTIYTDEKRPYVLGRFLDENGKICTVKFSGETDFNFKKGWAHTNLSKYKSSLKDIKYIKYKQMYEMNLSICKQLMKSIVNISLIPQTGNLQLTKKGLGNDRIDTYLFVLDEFFCNNSNLLFNCSSYENSKGLAGFLSSFSDVETYCKEVYKIEGGIVDDLIESGKHPIMSPERTIAYMNLAYRVWTQRLRIINGFKNKSKELSKEIERCTNLLDSFFEI